MDIKLLDKICLSVSKPLLIINAEIRLGQSSGGKKNLSSRKKCYIKSGRRYKKGLPNPLWSTLLFRQMLSITLYNSH